MLGKGRNQQRLNDEIAEDARLAGEEHGAALETLANALGKPPPELVKLLKASGFDPKKPLNSDPARLEELLAKAHELLGDRAVEAQAIGARMYDAPAPLSPTACTSVRRRRAQ
jgi:hypothetical protein